MAIREVVLDTETTGLGARSGDRLVEIGCVELIGHIPTGRFFHKYFNPERDMPEAAFKVHGLSGEFLADKPLFRDGVKEFLDFIEGSILVIHNAPFDMGFLQNELEICDLPPITNAVIDTVTLAREKHPGARVSLDALCKSYGIDNSGRTVHGALTDSELLAEVYLELIGGRQASLSLANESTHGQQMACGEQTAQTRQVPLASRLDDEQRTAHREFLANLSGTPVWLKY